MNKELRKIAEKVFSFYKVKIPKTMTVGTLELLYKVAVDKKLINEEYEIDRKPVGRPNCWLKGIEGFVLWGQVEIIRLSNPQIKSARSAVSFINKKYIKRNLGSLYPKYIEAKKNIFVLFYNELIAGKNLSNEEKIKSIKEILKKAYH